MTDSIPFARAISLLAGIAIAVAACSSDEPATPCTGPECAPPCAAGTTACGATCLDTKNDAANCGACGKACSPGEQCASGACLCDAGRVSCSGPAGGACVDTTSDALHCGSCGAACAGDETCVGGSCVCPVTSVSCDGKCTDPQSNAKHCGATEGCGASGGAAGVACSTGLYCSSGACASCSTWSVGASVSVGHEPVALATADLNGDGKIDLLVANMDGLDVLRGNGDGTFVAIQRLPWGTNSGQSVDIGVADFDGDGHLDVALATHNAYSNYEWQLVALYGYGDGTFDPDAQQIATPADAEDIAGLRVGDFNKDGKPDIVVVKMFLPGYGTFLNAGHRSFHPAVFATTGPQSPGYVATADFDGDGNLDLVLTNDATATYLNEESTLDVVLGHGDGTFGSKHTFVAGPIGEAAVAADFNGDGKPDIAVVARSSAGILEGKGDGTFTPATRLVTYGGAARIIATDLSQDGIVDLVVSGGVQRSGLDESGIVEIRFGVGDGSFLATQELAGGSGSVTVADVNGDGKPDILAANRRTNQVIVYLGTKRSECP